MKLLKWFAFILSLLFVSLAILLSLKTERMIVQASYMMLACEKCHHMKVEKSSNNKLLGKIIIPSSSDVKIEDILNEIALTKDGVCFTGKAYHFNINVFGLKPDGIRFKVEDRLPLVKCNELNHLIKSSS